MELKKNPNVNIGRNSSLYFAIGLNVMLFFTWTAFEYKSYDKAEYAHDILKMTEEFEEDIPITNLNTPPPPPVIPAAPEIITIVEDVQEIEETIIESTETNQEEEIQERIVDVDEVEVEEVDEEISVPFAAVENVPIFPGCKGNNDELKRCFNKKILEHVQKNFKYPEIAQELGIHGRVFVLFAIDSKGHISDVRTRGPDKSLEKEAARIIDALPVMTPGKQRGKPVKVPYSIPIHFKYVSY